MKLEQSFEVAAPLDRVWAALIDVERVAPCLPGADITGRNDDGSYNGTFRVKIGPTAAAYVGKLEMSEVDEAAHKATMNAAGTDRRGQGGAKATILSVVREGGAAGVSVVEVSTDYSITGRLARFGRGGMIEEIGNRLLTEFAASLQAMLAGPGEYETFIGVPAVPAAEGVAAKPESEAEKSRRKPRKDLAAAADAVAAASEPPAAAEPEPVAVPSEPEPVPEEPAAEPEPEPEPESAMEAVAEEELAAVMPEASEESEPPAAEEPPAPEPEPEPEPAPEPVPAPVPPPPAPEPPPPPPAPEPPPPPAPEPPPPPPPAPEPGPLDVGALAGTTIIDRVKRNPAPLIALLFVLLLLRRRRRRGRSG